MRQKAFDEECWDFLYTPSVLIWWVTHSSYFLLWCVLCWFLGEPAVSLTKEWLFWKRILYFTFCAAEFNSTIYILWKTIWVFLFYQVWGVMLGLVCLWMVSRARTRSEWVVWVLSLLEKRKENLDAIERTSMGIFK